MVTKCSQARLPVITGRITWYIGMNTSLNFFCILWETHLQGCLDEYYFRNRRAGNRKDFIGHMSIKKYKNGSSDFIASFKVIFSCKLLIYCQYKEWISGLKTELYIKVLTGLKHKQSWNLIKKMKSLNKIERTGVSRMLLNYDIKDE